MAGVACDFNMIGSEESACCRSWLCFAAVVFPGIIELGMVNALGSCEKIV